jgi:hypothetical protein
MCQPTYEAYILLIETKKVGTTMSAVDAVDGSFTGIAICHIAVSYEEPPMSLVGTKQTFQTV